MHSEHYGDFDWQSLTKKELKILYHKIMDTADRNDHYKILVMEKWNISAFELNNRIIKSIAQRILNEQKKGDAINNYLNKRWSKMTTNQVNEDRTWIKEQFEYLIPN